MIPARAIAQVTVVLMRHVPPLIGLLAFGWSVGQFLVCAVFNTTWPIGVIVATNIAVSDRLAAPAAFDAKQPISDLLKLGTIALVTAIFLGALFGWVTVVVAAQGDAHTFDRSLLLSIGMTVVSGLVAAFTQCRVDITERIDEVTRKQRDQPAVFALLASAAIVLFVSAQLVQSGRYASYALALVVTVLFIVRDMRPDFLRRILPLGGR